MQVFATYPLTYKQSFNLRPTELLLSVANCKARCRRTRLIITLQTNRAAPATSEPAMNVLRGGP